MSDLTLGIIVIAFDIVMTLMFLGTPNAYFFLFFFWFIGIGLTIQGAKQEKTNKEVEKEGYTAIGQILEIFATGTTYNGEMEYKADVVCRVNGNPRIFTVLIGYGKKSYKPGSFVKIKYYKNNALLLTKVSENRCTKEDLEAFELMAKRKGISFENEEENS